MQWLQYSSTFFQTLRVEYPQIKKTFLQLDSAARYHNGLLLLCLAEIGKKTGIKLICYDFSEPQAGERHLRPQDSTNEGPY